MQSNISQWCYDEQIWNHNVEPFSCSDLIYCLPIEHYQFKYNGYEFMGGKKILLYLFRKKTLEISQIIATLPKWFELRDAIAKGNCSIYQLKVNICAEE